MVISAVILICSHNSLAASNILNYVVKDYMIGRGIFILFMLVIGALGSWEIIFKLFTGSLVGKEYVGALCYTIRYILIGVLSLIAVALSHPL